MIVNIEQVLRAVFDNPLCLQKSCLEIWWHSQHSRPILVFQNLLVVNTEPNHVTFNWKLPYTAGTLIGLFVQPIMKVCKWCFSVPDLWAFQPLLHYRCGAIRFKRNFLCCPNVLKNSPQKTNSVYPLTVPSLKCSECVNKNRISSRLLPMKHCTSWSANCSPQTRFLGRPLCRREIWTEIF